MDYSKRTVIALDDCDVTCAGPPQEVAELCPNIEELDLGNNKITQWSEVRDNSNNSNLYCSEIVLFHNIFLSNFCNNVKLAEY